MRRTGQNFFEILLPPPLIIWSVNGKQYKALLPPRDCAFKVPDCLRNKGARGDLKSNHLSFMDAQTAAMSTTTTVFFNENAGPHERLCTNPGRQHQVPLPCPLMPLLHYRKPQDWWGTVCSWWSLTGYLGSSSYLIYALTSFPGASGRSQCSLPVLEGIL